MKKFSLLFVFLFLFVCIPNFTFSQLLTENFSYTDGTTLVANGWTQNGTSAVNPISVGTSNGLNYTGYASSGIGNAAIMTNNGQDIYQVFTAQTAGNVYISFLVNVSAALTGDYFLALLPSSSTTNLTMRTFIKAVGTTGWNLGISKSSETVTYGVTSFNLSTTYLVVLKYTFNTGSTTDDQFTGYVFPDPTLPATEGAAGTPEIPTFTSTSANADAPDLNRIELRQGTATNAPGLVIDGIRVGTTWNDAPLPVELFSFTSTMNGRNIQLNWETKTEIKFNKFEIDRALISANDAALTWVSVGTVQASGTSNSPKKYSYTENNLQAGKYSYRLKMIDNDGSYKFSDIVETEITLPKNFELRQNYPNPFNPSTKINYNLPSDSRVTLEIYNVLGVRIGQLVNQDQSAGFYSVDFNSSSLSKGISSGVYLYKITTVDKATGNNFSAIKKMMMLK